MSMNGWQNGAGILAFLRRGQQWLEISGYHVGDIHSDRPVTVPLGATLVGNVIAPNIAVDGLLYGSVFVREALLQMHGQVWGDVYAHSLRVEPGAQIQGWLCSIDEAEYLRIQDEGLGVTEVPELSDPDLPVDVLELNRAARGQLQLDLLRRMRAEAAGALAARAELEQSFDKRLTEVAGESAAQTSSLREKLATTQEELSGLRQTMNELLADISSRDERIERQSNELTVSRSLLEEQKIELAALKDLEIKQTRELRSLKDSNETFENEIHAARQQADSASERARSLEIALQASLQHTSEQEESLVRWQELAEVTEARAQSLESELEAARMQLQEAQRATELLRTNRDRLEEEWEKASHELEALHEVAGTSPDQTMGKLTERMAKLERDLEEAEQHEREYYEKLLWTQASLESTQAEVEKTRLHARKQEAAVEALKASAKQKYEDLKKWKARASWLAQRVREQQDYLRTMHASIRSTATDKSTLQDALRNSRLQLQAHEAEIEQYVQQVASQGQQLADARATLMERELVFRQLTAVTSRQSQVIKQLRAVAARRIQDLEAQLAHSQQQIDDLKGVLERRSRRTGPQQ